MRLLTAAFACLVALSACGDEDDAGAAAEAKPASVVLALRVSDGEGTTRRARLVCRTDGTAELTGYLRRENGRSKCRSARRLGRFLATQPDERRICTFIYGGPQTARVRGRVGERQIDRRFKRTNGCEIDDWDRVDSLLGPGLE
jgi:hypothetical protein